MAICAGAQGHLFLGLFVALHPPFIFWATFAHAYDHRHWATIGPLAHRVIIRGHF